MTRGISASANAAIHLSMLEGQDKMDLGPLILQDTFGIQEGPKPFKERRTFLFKKGIVITRRKRDSSERESYVIKDQLMVGGDPLKLSVLSSEFTHMHMHTQLSDISITQDMDKAKRNFIIYHKTTGTKFTLRVNNTSQLITMNYSSLTSPLTSLTSPLPSPPFPLPSPLPFTTPPLHHLSLSITSLSSPFTSPLHHPCLSSLPFTTPPLHHLSLTSPLPPHLGY